MAMVGALLAGEAGEALGEVTGHVLAGAANAAHPGLGTLLRYGGKLGGFVYSALRASGITTKDELKAALYANPIKLRDGLRKYPSTPPAIAQRRFAAAILALGANAAARQKQQDHQDQEGGQ